MYRAITGQAPLEAIDRMAEDDLIPPSHMGVVIEPGLEKGLLKGMDVQAKERYQKVEEFQAELLPAGQEVRIMKIDAGKGGVKPPEKDGGQRAAKAKPPQVNEKEPTSQPTVGLAREDSSFTIGKKVIMYAAAFITSGLLLYGGINLFIGGIETDTQEIEQAVFEEEYAPESAPRLEPEPKVDREFMLGSWKTTGAGNIVYFQFLPNEMVNVALTPEDYWFRTQYRVVEAEPHSFLELYQGGLDEWERTAELIFIDGVLVMTDIQDGIRVELERISSSEFKDIINELPFRR